MNYHNITKKDMNNGQGFRVVLWVAGCDHNCEGCHNKETHNPDGGIPFDENALNEIFEELEDKYVAGITFSGGDPLHKNNIEEINKIIDMIKEKYPNKNIWIYSGYTYEYLKKSTNLLDILRREIVEKCDVFVDGRFVLSLKDTSLPWKGSSNQIVWDMNTKTPIVDNVPVYDEDYEKNYAETCDNC